MTTLTTHGKTLAIDFLAYAFMPSKRVYLFSWLMLRRAWKNYRMEWIKKYPTITSENRDYQTLSVAVPIDILLKAVKDASIIQL